MTGLWPAAAGIDPTMTEQLQRAAAFPGSDELPRAWRAQWQDVWAPLAAYVVGQKQQHNAFVIGMHGGQGSGKSTLSKALAGVLQDVFGWNVAILSIDDLYLPHADRQRLAQTVHPLFATRGVPGTHDAALGIQLLQQLRTLPAGATLTFPAFDKASDDRLPPERWHQVTGPVDLVLFEGWCVGNRPVSADQLRQPLNALETAEDADGHWRQSVNLQLAGLYREWFAQIDCLLMLKVPDMQAVLEWRGLQEQGNRQSAAGNGPDRSLDAARLQRFVQHYQRLTEQALQHMPAFADLILTLNHQHQVCHIDTGGEQ